MRRYLLGGLAVLCCVMLPPEGHAANLSRQLEDVAKRYVAKRQAIEKISGVALHVDLKGHRPLDIYAGTNGRNSKRSKRIGSRTLFEIGSNTKSFTTALILKLEAEGRLNIDQTVGYWLPQYPAWGKVTIRSLLNMTSDIPNYSETISISRTMAADVHHQFSMPDLVAAVYGKGLPVPAGWFYSNTNTVLAAMIVEAASHMSYTQALESKLLEPLHLDHTFYADEPYPHHVQHRLPRGIYDNSDCTLYQPKPCTRSVLQPLVGQDVSGMNMSWAGPAGAIVSTPGDLATWVRDLFALRVVPQKQLDEMTSLVSVRTGKPIADVSAGDPEGFSLGLGRRYEPTVGGRFWFYEGVTLGFRTIFAYWPQYGLIITASTNSQPAAGEDQLAQDGVVKTFETLQKDGLIPAKR